MAGLPRLLAGFGFACVIVAHGTLSAQTLVEDWRARWADFEAEYSLVTARNQAWPLPFNCHDRQLYYQIFQVQFDTGWMLAHTLCDIHFDEETHALNQAGKAKVGWIMTNSPQHRRAIFVLQDDTPEHIDQRLISIRQWTQDAYLHLGEPQIAISTRVAHPAPGLHYETLNERYIQTLPAPVLPASDSIRRAVAQ